MIRAVVFDCFGVLLADGLRAQIESIDKVSPEKGQQLRDVLRGIDRGMLTRQESSTQMGEIMGIDPEELLRSIDAGVMKNKELVSFIKTLRPTYKLAMLSNVRSRARLDELFDPGELDELFDTVVASGDIGIIKPERRIYELTAELLGVEPEDCVMIDDIALYCEGAEAVGMRAIQFESNEKLKEDFARLIDSERQTD